MVEDRNSSKLNLSISKLLEVEEHVWSPMYGLKGNIDATVQVTCRDGEDEKTLVVPLELKTGRRDTNQSHRAQTALYTLLMSDRYGEFCQNAVLWHCFYDPSLMLIRRRCHIRTSLLPRVDQNPQHSWCSTRTSPNDSGSKQPVWLHS